MTWSIYKDSSKPYKEWEPCYTAWYIDEDTETRHCLNKVRFMHDGWVDVHFDDNVVTCGVMDGRWDSDTEEKILRMTSKTYHGTFIEGFYRTAGKFYVIMGS